MRSLLGLAPPCDLVVSADCQACLESCREDRSFSCRPHLSRIQAKRRSRSPERLLLPQQPHLSRTPCDSEGLADAGQEQPTALAAGALSLASSAPQPEPEAGRTQRLSLRPMWLCHPQPAEGGPGSTVPCGYTRGARDRKPSKHSASRPPTDLTLG